MTKRILIFLCGLLGAAIIACVHYPLGEEPPPNPAPDAGIDACDNASCPMPDAGVEPDAAVEPDAGIQPDAAPQCIRNEDCHECGATCVAGMCLPPPPGTCCTDADCPADKICDLDQKTCKPPECGGHEDCSPAEECHDRRCVPKPCTCNEDCPEGTVCRDQKCRPAPTLDCPAGNASRDR